MPEDLGRGGRTLHQAHELLSFHLDNLPLGVIEWDGEFRITRWSRHAEVLFGWSAEAVIGLSPFAFVHPADADAIAEVILQLLDGVAPKNVSTNRNLTRDGGLVECEWHNSIQLDELGRVTSVLSVVHDITELRETERYSRMKGPSISAWKRPGSSKAWSMSTDAQVAFHPAGPGRAGACGDGYPVPHLSRPSGGEVRWHAQWAEAMLDAGHEAFLLG